MSVRIFQPSPGFCPGIQAAFQPSPDLLRRLSSSTAVAEAVVAPPLAASPTELLWSNEPKQTLARSALAFGKDAPSYSAYPMKMTPLMDTPESRKSQRQRVGALIDTMTATNVPAERIAFLRARLELAERFDLMILDSGNLYFRRQYLSDPAVSADGMTLTGRDNADRRVKIPAGGRNAVFSARTPPSKKGLLDYSHAVYVGGAPATFHYHTDLHSAALFVERDKDTPMTPATAVEVGETIANLPELPTDYLERVRFLKQPDWRNLTIPMPVKTRFDFAAVNAEDDVPKNRQAIDVESYTFDVAGRKITISLPPAGSKLTAWQRRQGYYIPSEKDLPTLVKVLLQLVPSAFFPDELTVVFLPFAFKDGTVAQVNGKIMTFGGAKADNLDKWMKTTLLWAIQHESAHIFQDDNKTILALLYRCMLVDGWTTDYSQSHIQEYLAVLATDFFESPHLVQNFPNGYRLMYALIQMRQNGVKWGEKTQDEELAELGAGKKPPSAMRT